MTTDRPAPRHALVFGASGFVGRHLVLALAAAGARVTAAVRTAASQERLQRWLVEHGLHEHVGFTLADFHAPAIVHDEAAARTRITEIHNCAGTYRFGMSAAEAREANVGIVERIVDFAASLPKLGRLVHISGYRVGGQDPASVPWPEEARARRYRRLGAYEASKVESDAVLQARARERGVPFTIVNPSSVIGHSLTGETDQLIGLASTVQQLWAGSTRALPGNGTTFLPVVTVDYLAEFMAAAATDALAVDQSYWVLDERTPPLPVMLADLAEHLGVAAPRLRVPVAVIKRLPRWATGADPETLTFLSADRYPTRSANELAERHGLRQPDVATALQRWVDYLAARRFDVSEAGAGAEEGPAAGPGARSIDSAGGVRSFALGRANASRLVLPGLPTNADTWAPIAADLDARVVDLPGIGLSGPAGRPGSVGQEWDRWLSAVVGERTVDLVGHSLGAAAAVMIADRHPDQVRSLTLVAPFFLQPAPRRAATQRLAVRPYLRFASAVSLSRMLTGDRGAARLLASTAADLRRRGARAVARYLRQAASPAWRKELREMLDRYAGPVRIIVGERDPLDAALAPERARRSVVVGGAGHHPHLTHPEEAARLIADVVAAT